MDGAGWLSGSGIRNDKKKQAGVRAKASLQIARIVAFIVFLSGFWKSGTDGKATCEYNENNLGFSFSTVCGLSATWSREQNHLEVLGWR